MNQEELIKYCKQKDRNAQSLLYERYKGLLYNISLKYCTSKEEAQDNLQDAFLDIYKNIRKYKNQGSFEGWMKRITIYKAIKKYKKSIKTNTNIDDINLHNEINVDEDYLSKIPLEIILKCIQELPDRYRLVFSLYQLDDYNHNEISKLLSISVGTSKSNLFRAKKLLKDKITQYQNFDA
ncbi:sigma-70 family RNA polymerase sigma factor [uncultured Tenacibaculum sp.]|uniref:RNA polymerase sigma factor n=1 Tax=uncultured Tenacibaculum sp. TaxID=174713 RepID=UPI0026022E1B|nr:sigma-70 family RNA polymerase sigma factor [uncultured Tenacibaculum sp.]